MKEESEDNPESAVLERAEQLGRSYSPISVCGHCTRAPNGAMSEGKEPIRKLKKLAGYVDGGDGILHPPSVDELEFLRSELYPAFRDGYFQHCPDPEDCRICNDHQVECFHQRYGLTGMCRSTQGTAEIR